MSAPNKNRRRIIWGVGLVVAINIALGAANEFLPSGRVDGPTGSSFVTTDGGTAAWYELLRRSGSDVERITEPLDTTALDPESTLIINNVAFASEQDTTAVTEFVDQGGHLVLVVSPGHRGDFHNALNITSGHGGPRHQTYTPTGEHGTTTGINEIITAPEQAFVTVFGEQVLADGARILAFEVERGEGTVIVVANGSMFSNEYLAETDNAAFAVQVTKGRPVAFNEFGHGFLDDISPEPVLPDRWRWSLYLLGGALVLYLLAVGRRFGPPEKTTRDLHPPRRLFVESVATTLARTPLADATEPLRIEALRQARRRTGVSPEAPFSELLEAASAAGIDQDDVRALQHPIATEEAALAAGRVLAAATRTDMFADRR